MPTVLVLRDEELIQLYFLLELMTMVLVLGWLALLLVCVHSQGVTWSQVPSIRSGQISSIVTLTTSSVTSTSLTDQIVTYDSVIACTNPAQLKYGLSLMSYESWMTDVFSFNISLVDLTNSSITVRFLVLGNTFFTKAKTHYLVVWRPGGFPNNALPGSPPINASIAAYNNIDVVFGCYLTANLLSGSGTRLQTVGGNFSSPVYSSNMSQIVVSSMIAGMQLSNSLGSNDYVKVETFYSGAFFYNVTVENNNYLKYICLTTVAYDPYVDTYYFKTIMEHSTMSLTTTNSGLTTVAYSERFDGSNRMFFGFSQLNLSMSDIRYLNIEASNISLVSQYYDKNTALNEVTINMLFFALRTCTDTTQYYYPNNYECLVTCPSNSIATPPTSYGSADFLLCNPCHYSCNTCNSGRNSNDCLSCPPGATSHRSLSGSSCPCNPGFIDVGVTNCVTCNQAMPGCVACSSSTVCLDCDNITYVLDGTRCGCAPGYYLTSGYCLDYSGCLEATLFNNSLACITCDTALNYVRITATTSCSCNEGYFLNTSVPECYDVCGDGITALGHCDDGNTDYGDGCDQNCNVEKGYHCYTAYNSSGNPGLSTCILITNVGVTLLYSKRILTSNSFIMAVKLSPIKAGLTSTSFNSTNFVTTLPIQNQEITYDPSSGIVSLQAEYLENIESNSYSLVITYPNDLTFYADSTKTGLTMQGINAKLVLDSRFNLNSFLPYMLVAEGIIAVLLAIFASVVGLKLAGIQLLLPVQLLYFSLATLGTQTSYTSSLANLKYANGYSTVTSYDYFRTYDQNANLVAITYESEFLLSTNFMIVIFVVVLIWLLIHHIRIKCKEDSLEQFLTQKGDEPVKSIEKNKEINSDESQEHDPEQDEQRVKLSKKRGRREEDILEENDLREDHHYSLKIFSFEVDRVYFIFYVILINQMLFGFTVMSMNLALPTFYYSEEISVIACNLLTFVLMGNVVFIFYDQTSNKMINFTCISDRYAYLYLLLNTLIILVIAYSFQQSFAIYIVTVLSALFVLLIIIERPYSKELLEFQNLVALYLSVMLLASEILLCVVNGVSLTDIMELTIIFVIVGLIMLGQILTIIRIILKVNFKKAFDDLKNPNSDRDRDDKKMTRVKEKNLDLLGKDDVEILPSDSVRNGLFTPKEKMIDWEARNTEEYESVKLRQGKEANDMEGQNETNENKESQDKDNKLNELELLKKRLRNTLKIKRETESKKDD